MYKFAAALLMFVCTSSFGTMNNNMAEPAPAPAPAPAPHKSSEVKIMRSSDKIIMISRVVGGCKNGDLVAGYADAQGNHTLGCWFVHGQKVLIQWNDGDISRIDADKFVDDDTESEK